MRPFSKLELIFLTTAVLSCREAVNDRSKNRPSSELEETEGYLDSTQQRVTPDEEFTVQVRRSTVKGGAGTLRQSADVRMRVLPKPPGDIEGVAELGSPLGDVV